MYIARYTRSTAERPGYRTNGARKSQLINQANILLMDIGSKGVNVLALLKYLGISPNRHTGRKGDSKTITTKEWTGVIGRLKSFKKDNGL